MKIELYLDNTLVEIDQDIDFVLNKQFTELTDLTSIIVDYSKTIRVPMTPRNNELFNYIYKLEHRVIVGQDIVSYDPSQKIPMYMTYNGSMVMEGYALLNSIDLNTKRYEVNLYGQLGKIFSILKEKTLSNYSMEDNGFWADIVMNTRTMYDSFNNDHHNLPWSSSDWTDFYGFAPQLIGKTDLFDTTGYEEWASGGEVTTFADTINATRGGNYSTYVEGGLDFNQFPEMRTYMTRPYVYVDKLVQLVQNEINNGEYDGYTMTLNSDWFNVDNPWYYNMVYFPGEESVVDKGEGVNGQLYWDNTEQTMNFTAEYLPTVSSQSLDGYTYSTSGNYITITGGDAATNVTLNADGIVVRDRVTGVDSSSSFNTEGRWAFYNLSRGMELIPIRYIGIYDENGNLLRKLYLCDNEIVSIHSTTFGTTWAHYSNVWNNLKKQSPKVATPNNCGWTNNSSSGNWMEVTQVYNFGQIPLGTSTFKFKLGCDLVRVRTGELVQADIAKSSYEWMKPFKNDKYKNKEWNNNATWNCYYRGVPSMGVSTGTYRSMSTWSIKDVLGSSFNPFRWLIDYAKKFRLWFDIDYATKTIDLKGSYFNDPEYKKVIVDYSKPVVIEPIVDKYNKIVFGYADNKSRKGVQYIKNYGVDYGDVEIRTGIEVNNETLALNPNGDESVFIPTKMNALAWVTLNSTQSMRYSNSLYTNRVVNTLDKEGKIQYFPFFAFRWLNGRNPAQQNVPFYYLSDDSPNQKSTGKYTYLQGSSWSSEVEATQGGNNVYYRLALPFIPQFDNYINKTTDGHTVLYWSTFAVPAELYNGSLPSNMEMTSIYDRWSRYLNEIFNINNKKVTCYVRMSYPEFINFKFNQLFVIDNNVFLVNKIIDFNPNSEAPTKVELIQIADVTNLA